MMIVHFLLLFCFYAGYIAFVSVMVDVERFDAVVLVLLALLVWYFVVWLLFLLMH